MFKLIPLAAIAASALVLAGCSAASSPNASTPTPNELTSPDVSVTETQTGPADALVGDTLTETATATLTRNRTDKVILRIESSPDGVTWTTVKEVRAKGPVLTLSDAVTATAAGNVAYRAVVVSPSSHDVLGTSATSTAKVSDIKELIRTYFYDETAAYQQSTAAGMAWIAANDSPVFDQTSASWKQGYANEVTAGYRQSNVPDLTTVSPDPTWKLVATSCSAAMTAPPAGRTFIVTDDFSSVYNGYSKSQKSDVHVTLSNGKLVAYQAICDGA